MTTDLAWWGTLVGWLAAQTMALVAVGAATAWWARAPQARRAVWQAVLIAVAIVWIGEAAGLPGWLSRQNRPTETPIISIGFLQSSPPVLSGELLFRPSSGDAAPEIAVGEAARPLVSPTPKTKAPPVPVKWPGWIWLGGAVVLLLEVLIAQAGLAMQSRGMSEAGPETEELVGRLGRGLGLRTVRVRVWNRLRGPIAFGLWRPTVALPDDFAERFTPGQREAMLAHELAHLAGRDPLAFAFADFLAALAWWHPAIWWARRQLQAASEAVADEASALVPSGPLALAESLVLLARDLAAPRLARGLGVVGGRFRSDLGRRVSALAGQSGSWTRLAGGWRWWPRLAALSFAVVLAIGPVRSGFSGSVLAALNSTNPGQTPGASPDGPKAPPVLARAPESPSSARNPEASIVNSNAAPSAASNLLTKVFRVDPAIFEKALRKLEAHPRVLSAHGEEEPAVDPPSGGQFVVATNGVLWSNILCKRYCRVLGVNLDPPKSLFYNDRAGLLLVHATVDDLKRVRVGLEPFKAASTPGESKPAQVSSGRRAIMAKLESIRLPEVKFDGLPLGEVLRRLRSESVKRDTNGVGVNFMINSHAERPPATEEPSAPVAPPLDLGKDVTISINPAINDMRLVDVLDAITKVADRPITYSTENYAVVFMPKPSQGTNLLTKVFKVDTNTFLHALVGVRGAQIKFGAPWNDPVASVANMSVTGRVRKYFIETGINFDPPKSMFFNDRTGRLLVRATEEDMNKIGQAIEVLNIAPAPGGGE